MKRKRILATLLCGVICATSIFASPATAAGEKKTTSEKKVKWPTGPKAKSLSSDSAIVMELSTGSILYKKNIHKQHYPASITKILTAMLTAENCSMNETVTFSEEAVYGIESGSSTIYSDVGEKLTVEQCLYAIMLESANEVCLGVAEHISGSVNKFVNQMNERVKALGLKDTHFNNPNGLPDPKHYTTAYDMAVIAREAMKNSTFRKVTAAQSYVMPKTNTHKTKRYWRNHHQMVNGYKFPKYEYKYCIGGKTGYTNAAGNTLVTFGEKDGMELVCVIMKSSGPPVEPNEYTDSTKLLNFAFENYRKYTVNEKNSDVNEDLFNNYDSYFDVEKSPVHLAGESSVVLPKGVKLSDAKQKISYDENVTLKKGDNVIGHVTYTYGGKTVGSTDIVYTKTEEGEVSHLDAASRKIVGKEIQEIKDSQKESEKKANVWRKVKGAIVSVYRIPAVKIVLLVLLVALLIFGLCCALKRIELPRFRRRRRSTAGYRSKGARRNHAKRMRRDRRGRKESKRVRRNHSKHYEKPVARKSGEKSRSKGVRYHKRHKNTKESFGKNFFDF